MIKYNMELLLFTDKMSTKMDAKQIEKGNSWMEMDISKLRAGLVDHFDKWKVEERTTPKLMIKKNLMI